MQKFFGNIMRKKLMIMRKRCQIIGKFQKLIKLFPWLLPMCKIHINFLLRLLVLYDTFDLLMPFVDRFFFVQHSYSIVSVVEFVQSLVTRY